MAQYSKIPLDEEADTGDDSPESGLLTQTRKSGIAGWEFLNSRFIIIQLVLLGVYGILFRAFPDIFTPRYHGANLFYCKRRQDADADNTLLTESDAAPAREAVKYEITHFNATLWIDSPYVQPPSPETDKAWHDLVDSKLQVILLQMMTDLDQTPTSSCLHPK